MTTMTDTARRVTGGVDTHRDLHVVCALDERGAELGVESFPTTPAGYRRMLHWLRHFGEVGRVGVEGTGSYGAGLTRYLQTEGVEVIEICCPNRQRRRSHGKSDPVDAVAAARAVFSGDAVIEPKIRTGNVEAIRALRIADRSARHNRIKAINQMRALLLTGPEDLREQFRGTTVWRMVRGAARLRPGDPTTPIGATKFTLRILARRVLELEAELKELETILKPLVAQTAPELVARHGVGTETAGALLVAAGDNPERLRDERAFAHYCGTSPIDASSGTVVRKRLNRGGNRQANEALWRIVMVRLVSDPATRHYMERRTKEGLSKKEAIRCLKRYVARELYPFLASIGP
ncbi:MAG TPA: IS110 family transposase [Acidimicrobiales bacterium]|nr:IS110 family transposase [Acidimicrobiales bacterium]